MGRTGCVASVVLDVWGVWDVSVMSDVSDVWGVGRVGCGTCWWGIREGSYVH